MMATLILRAKKIMRFIRQLEKDRTFDRMGTTVDTLGVVAALLLAVPLNAVTSVGMDFWTTFQDLVLTCNEQDPLFSFDSIIDRYRSVNLACTAVTLMTIIGVIMFHLLATEANFEQIKSACNLLLVYLGVLVGLDIYFAIWVYQFLDFMHSISSTDYCNRNPLKAFINIDNIVHVTSVIFAVLFPALLLTLWQDVDEMQITTDAMGLDTKVAATAKEAERAAVARDITPSGKQSTVPTKSAFLEQENDEEEEEEENEESAREEYRRIVAKDPKHLPGSSDPWGCIVQNFVTDGALSLAIPIVPVSDWASAGGGSYPEKTGRTPQEVPLVE